MPLRSEAALVPNRLQAELVDGRYVNPALRDMPEPGLREFLRWRHERRGVPKAHWRDEIPQAPVRAPLGDPPAAGIAATWVGHSSVVLQLDGRTYLCDPVWSERIGHGTVKRLTPPGVPWDLLPRADAILLSHNHYDHLDVPTLKRLPRETPVFCPMGVGKLVRALRFRSVTELTWWQAAPAGDHRLTLVPAQHFSGRGAFDRNKSLWGGFVVQGGSSSAYFVGDSGYFPGFRQIGAAFPALDLVMMPSGAYEPRWFMSPVHVDPAEAGQAFLDTGGRVMMPIHWGTFRLADETIDEPPRALRAWWDAQKLDPDRLAVPRLGGTTRVDAAHRRP